MRFKKWMCTVLFAFLMGLVLCGAALAEGDEQVEAVDVEAMLAEINDAFKGPEASNMLKVKVDEAYHSEGREGRSEDDAYIIDSIDDLETLAFRVGSGIEPGDRYYRLAENIEIGQVNSAKNWLVIGTYSNPFKGHFDGAGKTIMVTIENNAGAALFGNVKTSIGYAIKDLHVKGSVTGSNAGGIVGVVYSGAVQDCTFDGTVEDLGNDKKDEGTAAGGIAMAIDGGSITGCNVLSGSTVKSTGFAVGGIVGKETGKGAIKKCISYATIVGEADTYKGGIAGTAVNSSRTFFSDNEYKGPSSVALIGKTLQDAMQDLIDSTKGSGSSGGGCSAGFGLAAIAGAALLFMKKR